MITRHIATPTPSIHMQQLIKQRGKDKVVNVAQRNSVTQAVDRLLRDGAIEIQEVQRDRKRPERTIYRITTEGRAVFQRWMREMLSVPAREFPQLSAALAFLGLFSCDDVVQQLRTRASVLEQQLAATAPVDSSLPRVFLIEDEYLNAMTQAELHWGELPHRPLAGLRPIRPGVFPGRLARAAVRELDVADVSQSLIMSVSSSSRGSAATHTRPSPWRRLRPHS